MENFKWNYFQYRRSYNYPVYLRFKHEELNPKYQHVLNEMGFSELTESEAKKIQLQRPNIRILTIQEASARLHHMINGSDLLDKYGQETLSLQGNVPIYVYRKVGVMALPSSKPLWDLAIHQDISQTDQMVGFRIVLMRFLAQALADQGLLCYWGTVKDENVIVMKQLHSFGEAVIIDVAKKVIFSNGGEMRLGSHLKIIRKDKEVKVATLMGREELISFLSVNSCLLSFSGITAAMKRAIYELSVSASASYAATESNANL